MTREIGRGAADTGKTFRVFISSTFADLVAERNALQHHVFPSLREFCARRGARFQPIDLRWGIREEAALDHRTMRVCLDEVRRCQQITPKPNFIVLLGDRYGWRPIPAEIPDDEFQSIIVLLPKTDRAFLRRWYKPDKNAARWGDRHKRGVKAVYLLRRRTGAYRQSWEKEESRLRSILTRPEVIAGIWPYDSVRREAELPKYLTSATEQEILRGALGGDDLTDHIFCFFRSLRTRPVNPAENDAKNYFDIAKNEDGTLTFDENAAILLKRLKQRLAQALPQGMIHYHYFSDWKSEPEKSALIESKCRSLIEALSVRLSEGRSAVSSAGLPEEIWRDIHRNFPDTQEKSFVRHSSYPAVPITLDHLPRLCADVFWSLATKIESVLDEACKIPSPRREKDAHARLELDYTRFFTGREDALIRLETYVAGASVHPLLVLGNAGSGKSALLARAAVQTRAAHPDAAVISRFIGATAESIDARALLENLCREVSDWLGLQGGDIAAVGYWELAAELPHRLSLASAEHPLIVFIDAVDQLSLANDPGGFSWIPNPLPPHVRLVISARTDLYATTFLYRMPGKEILDLESLPFSQTDVQCYLDRRLDAAGRRLDERQNNTVLAACGESVSPLYAVLATEEALRWRWPSSVQSLPADLSGAIDSLVDRLAAPENHGHVLVNSVIALLSAARDGLTEDELLDLLARNDEIWQEVNAYHSPPEKILPVVLWSRLFFDLQPYLSSRLAGDTLVMRLFHSALEIPSGERLEAHAALARYFADAPTWRGEGANRHGNKRKLAELPYQQAEAALFLDLTDTLTCYDFLFAKVTAAGPDALILDFIPVIDKDANISAEIRQVLRLIQDAVRLSAPSLRRDPTQFCSQLHARLLRLPNQYISFFLAEAEAKTSFPWLRALTPGLRQAGGRNCVSFGRHGRDRVRALIILPDSTEALSASDDGTLKHWDLLKSREIGQLFPLPDPVSAEGKRPGITGLSMNEEGTMIFASTGYGTLWRFLLNTNPRQFDCLWSNRRTLTGVAATSYGLIVCSSDTSVVRITRGPYDQFPEPPRVLGRHGESVKTIAATTNGDRIATGDREGTICVWEPDRFDQRPVMVLHGHLAAVNALAFTPDGSWLVSGSADRTVRLWDMNDTEGSPRTLTSHRGSVDVIALSRSGDMVLSASSAGEILGSPLDSHADRSSLEIETSEQVCAMAIFTIPDGHERLLAGGHDGSIYAWDINHDPLAGGIRLNRNITALAIGPGGRTAFAGSEDGVLYTWDLLTGQESSEAKAQSTHGINCLNFAADLQLLTGSNDAMIRVWESDHLERPPIELSGHKGAVKCVISLQDHRIVSTCMNNLLIVRNPAFVETARFKLQEAWGIFSLTAGPGDNCVYAGTVSGKIFEIDLVYGTEKLLYDQGRYPIHAIASAYQGRRLAGAGEDGTVKLWTRREFGLECLGEIRHAGPVKAVAFGADGRYLLSASEDRMLLLTKVNSPPEPIARFLAESALVSCAVNLDGDRLVAADDAGNVYVLHLKMA